MRDFKVLKLFALFKLRIKHYPLPAVFLLTFLTLILAFTSQSFAAMGDYCVVPPYVKRDVSVNIMVLMDNSTDMKNSAYSHDSDTDYADSAYTPNATYDNYYGYFDPRGCYAPPGAVTTNFKYVWAVDYILYSNGCNADGAATRYFNGNVLNWITMSRLSVMKKVIMGGKFEPRPDTPQRIVFEGSDWIGGSTGCKWTITGGTTLTVSDKGVPEPCNRYPRDTWTNIKIDITPGIEDIRGVFQDFVDKYTYDNSYNNLTSETPDGKYDKNAPRFGLTDFGAGGAAVIDQTIPQDNPINSYFTSVQNAVNRDLSPLATAHKAIIDYFDNESPTTGTDPYKSCVSYEKPCMSPAPCRKSFILMITSGGDVAGTAVTSLPSQCSATETRPLVRNACYAYNTDLRTAADLSGKQNLETYVIQTFGAGTSDCSSATGNIKALCDAAAQGGGNYYSAGSDNLAATIRKALQDMIKRAAAGTAASVLASGEGSGANLIQAVFYPRAMTIPKGGIFGTEIDWIGRMTNYWYYVDPFFAASSIYEDQASASVNTLDLTDDNKIQLYFDASTERTKARRWYDSNGDGVPETAISPDIEFEKLSSIWEAGVKLWERTSARTIKTWLDSNNNGVVDSGEFIDFSTTNAATLWPYLNLATVATDDLNSSGAVTVDDATMLIEYIHGTDFTNLRSRKTAIDLNNNGDTLDIVNGVSESEKVWKLGDVLNSTPKVSSWIPLNSYHEKYTDTTYGDSSTGGYINTANYKNRGMVFAGANDGMLHAFKLGKFELKWSGQGNYQKARLRRTCLLNPATSCSADATCSAITAGDRCPQLGEEMWSFIPKNVLPYL
ncbi:MAG: hypothetical protein Q8N14_04710, partial [Candidatus Omnitrophota bacterium]|nr:hypothetical protein [Candidatus Omnitrophota bacterium]